MGGGAWPAVVQRKGRGGVVTGESEGDAVVKREWAKNFKCERELQMGARLTKSEWPKT